MIDFILVGQGIAGSVLALQLLKHGQRILVINNQKTNIASSVAAGVYNPITSRVMVKTWLAEDLFPYLTNFYQEATQTLGVRVLNPMPIFRPFLSAQERTEWLKRATQESYSNFIREVITTTTYQEKIECPHGGIVLKQAGYLDVKKFITATQAYLNAQHAYLEADFIYDHLCFNECVKYRNITARQIIFCEGPQVRKNPFFNKLPFRLVKGELLLARLYHPLQVIYNRGVFVLPKSANEAVIGATYDWKNMMLRPTKKARKTLEGKLQHVFNVPYTVHEQQVGVRPATFDRRPFIGIHPQYPQIAIFNGLGAKGVSLAPYFAKIFTNHLLLQKVLPSEVQLNRTGFL